LLASLQLATRGAVALERLEPDWWDAPTPVPSVSSAKSSLPIKQTAPQPPAVETSVASADNAIGAPRVDDLVQTLHQSETSVKQLQDQLVNMHSRLAKAENVEVIASGNVSLAKSGMSELALKAQDEADELKKLTLTSAQFQSSLDREDTQLAGVAKRVQDANKNALVAASVAKDTAGKKALLGQDALNNRMWKLLDPNGKDTLPEAEKQVQVMEEGVVKLRSRVAGEVKTQMVSKMPGVVQNLRKAIHRLGSAHSGDHESSFGDAH